MRWVQRSWRLAAWLFGFLGFLVVLVSITPAVLWWGRWLAGPWDDPTGEVLIVLGGSIQSDGMIGENSYWRSVYAVRVFREDGFHHMVVTGGGTPVPVADPMRAFVQCMGVPATATWTETRSKSTRENALNTRLMLRHVPGRKVLLTSDYHMFRASRTFAKAGLDVAPRPFPDVLKRGQGWRGRWVCFLDLVEESVKIAYYYSRGWI